MTRFAAALGLIVPLAPLAVGTLAVGSGLGVDTVRESSPRQVDLVASTVSTTAPPRAEAPVPTPPVPSIPGRATDLEPVPIGVQGRSTETSIPKVADPFAPIGSPDVGDHCAASLAAADITTFFAHPIGSFQGGDYQRAVRLPDDRVLWTFQDAFIGGALVHNVGMIQSGRCFTLLDAGATSWLLADRTSPMRQWHWILGGGASTDGTRIDVFVVQMNETGSSYLSHPRPTAMHRVVLDAVTLEVIDVVDEMPAGDDLYGWDVTSDAEYTYLYAWCYQQFGYDTLLGFGECASDVEVARVPLGDFDGRREYWDGTRWTLDPTRAAPIVDAGFVGSGNNPTQITFDGSRFLLVEKRDDWWGRSVEFGVAPDPQGPFTHVASVDEPLACDRSTCNTYFAAWIPWNDEGTGHHIWSISRNRWNGTETHDHLADYRPTFGTIDLAPPGTAAGSRRAS